MLIDKILSRFKIKTKVLIFVLPFVVTISAVGLTGLYASGLLQGRMEISNSVLQSLSGFKDLYGSMDDFLRITSQQARDKLLTDLKTQQGVLDQTLSQVGEEASGRDSLAEASRRTKDISGVVDKLWALHEQEEALHQQIDAAQKSLISTRFTVSYQAEELQTALQSDESAATVTLRTADRLLKGGDFLGTVASGFSKPQTPQDKIAFINEQMPEIIKAQRLIAISVPTNQKNVIDALAATIDASRRLPRCPLRPTRTSPNSAVSSPASARPRPIRS